MSYPFINEKVITRLLSRSFTNPVNLHYPVMLSCRKPYPAQIPHCQPCCPVVGGLNCRCIKMKKRFIVYRCFKKYEHQVSKNILKKTMKAIRKQKNCTFGEIIRSWDLLRRWLDARAFDRIIIIHYSLHTLEPLRVHPKSAFAMGG